MQWGIVYYADATGQAPGWTFLLGCPAKVRGTFIAVIDAGDQPQATPAAPATSTTTTAHP